MTVNVLFLWAVPPRLQTYLRHGLTNVPECKLCFPEPANEAVFETLAPNADVLVGWRPSQQVLQAATRVKVIINPGAGVQHLFSLFRTVYPETRPILINGHGNAGFVAQHALALLLALSNQVIRHHTFMVAGRWRTGDAEGASIPLWQQSIGLLGYGAVNRRVHRLLAPFGGEVHVLRRQSPDPVETFPTPIIPYTPADLPAFLRAIKILVIAVPETAATRNLLDTSAFACMNPDLLLVNVARGSVINEHALFHALQTHRIRGAAIDVWYEDQSTAQQAPPVYPFHLPFHTLDNIVLSPHRAASPMDDLQRWDEFIENLQRFTAGRSDLLNQVDFTREY